MSTTDGPQRLDKGLFGVTLVIFGHRRTQLEPPLARHYGTVDINSTLRLAICYAPRTNSQLKAVDGLAMDKVAPKTRHSRLVRAFRSFKVMNPGDYSGCCVDYWFAPHDLAIGKEILDDLDGIISMRDKAVLIQSESAIVNDWVKDEIIIAFEKERWRNETMLFPIRSDDAVTETGETWANKLRSRNIGSFTL